MEISTKETSLIVKINNSKPIELIDLTKSFLALSQSYNSYIVKTSDNLNSRDSRLYIKEVKSGSVIYDLIEKSVIVGIPFMENINTIVGFATFLNKSYSYFLNNEGSDPELTSIEYNNLSEILSPVAKDNASQINLNVSINGDVTNVINLDFTQANAIQNLIKLKVGESKKQDVSDILQNVLFYWEQATRDLSNDKNNKGKIDEISEKALKVLFENESIKEKMILSQQNPFLLASYVDVKTMTVKNKIVAYKIIAVHDSFLIDND